MSFEIYFYVLKSRNKWTNISRWTKVTQTLRLTLNLFMQTCSGFILLFCNPSSYTHSYTLSLYLTITLMTLLFIVKKSSVYMIQLVINFLVEIWIFLSIGWCWKASRLSVIFFSFYCTIIYHKNVVFGRFFYNFCIIELLGISSFRKDNLSWNNTSFFLF